jgi:threonylcarbamoyladenosine tRNA methylthiotransferase MtaB
MTTDVIVGFPGETEQEFIETMAFVKAMNFAGGHVFTYSARPGTPAARMKGQIRGEVAKARSAALRTVFAESAETYQRRFVGKTMTVLWEAPDQSSDCGWRLEGLTDNYLRVVAHASEPRWNIVNRVRLDSIIPGGLQGQIV